MVGVEPLMVMVIICFSVSNHETGDALAFGTGTLLLSSGQTLKTWVLIVLVLFCLCNLNECRFLDYWISWFCRFCSFGWCYDVNNFNWASTRIDGYFHSWHHYAFKEVVK